MEARSRFRFTSFRTIVAVLTMAAQPLAISHQSNTNIPDPERERIMQMVPGDVALSILNLRTDLNEYTKYDLTTTSGQYELFYDEVMRACNNGADQLRLHQGCSGAMNLNFIDYLQSNQRICPSSQTGSCWKPDLQLRDMHNELIELVKKSDLRKTRQRPEEMAVIK
jgi:hypothetical protein